MRSAARLNGLASTRPRNPSRRTSLVLFFAFALAWSLSACGAAAPGSETTSAVANTVGKVDNSAAIAYIGGTAGKADTAKSPITVGFVNQQGGIPSWPESTVAAKAAVAYINAELGGIQGHPLKLKTCFVVSSEEEGQKCGQEMANDPAVRAVVTGNLIVGNASLYKTIGNSKPVFGTPTTLPDFVAPNNHDLVAAGFGVLPTMAIYAAKNLGAKNVAMVYADEPGGQAAAGLVKTVLGTYGSTLTDVPVPTTSTDLIGAITAAKAQTADAFLAVVTAPLCIQIAKAQQQLELKVPVVATVLCTDQSVSKALGDLPAWSYGADTSSPFVANADPQAQIYAAKVRQYGGDNANLGGFAPHPFAKLMTVAKLLNQIGADQITPAALNKAASMFKGPQWMGPQAVACGALPDTPAICNTSARIYDYRGDSKWTDATHGQWIDVAHPPAP